MSMRWFLTAILHLASLTVLSDAVRTRGLETRDKHPRRPIIFVGCFLGQSLDIKDTRWNSICGMKSKVDRQFHRGWLMPEGKRLLCAVREQLMLSFDPQTNRTSSPKGVQVRVAPGWEGVKLLGFNSNRLLEFLERNGYVKDFDLLPMPYDWRLSVRDWELGAYIEFKNLVESAHRNVGRRVVLTGNSMSGPFIHAFLSWVRRVHGSGWVKANIGAWVPVGAPWNGAVNSLTGLMAATSSIAEQGNELGVVRYTCPKCNPPILETERRSLRKSAMLGMLGPVAEKVNTMLTRLIRTLPSVYWISGGVDHSMKPPDDHVYLKWMTSEGEKAYKASEIPEHFVQNMNDTRAATLMAYTLSVGTTRDPHVPVHCVFGYNVRTDVKISGDFNVLKGAKFAIELGDGDGTVHTEGSLDVCTRWESTVKTYKVPGVIHNGMLNVQQVADIILAVATDDDESWKAWKSPKYTEIKFMEKDPEKVSEQTINIEDLVDVDEGS